MTCFDSINFYLQELQNSVEHWIKCHCARGWERGLHMWKVENCSRASAPPPLIFCYLLPSLFPLLLSVLSPSHLFVLGTYQPERGKRRREGGGVSQHVRQERGGKRERIACGEGTRKAGWEVGSRLKESSFFFFIHLLPPIINCCSSNWLLKFCWAPVRERTPTRERKAKTWGWGITMVRWEIGQDGGDESCPVEESPPLFIHQQHHRCC